MRPTEVLGIDVAARRGCDVVALDTDLIARPLGRITGAAGLRELLARRPAPPRVVGIDAPRGWAVAGRRRSGERALQALGLSLYTTPDAGRGTGHGFYAWMETGFGLYGAVAPVPAFEVYPYASAVALHGHRPPPGSRTGPGKREWRRAALHRAGVDTTALRTIDEVDAGLAAFTAWLVLTGGAEVLGEPEQEAIAVPRWLAAWPRSAGGPRDDC